MQEVCCCYSGYNWAIIVDEGAVDKFIITARRRAGLIIIIIVDGGAGGLLLLLLWTTERQIYDDYYNCYCGRWSGRLIIIMADDGPVD